MAEDRGYTVVKKKKSNTGTSKEKTTSKIKYNSKGKPVYATSTVKGYDYESGRKFGPRAAGTMLGGGKYMPKGGVVGPKTAKLTPKARAKALADARYRRMVK
jgi:hypothetical protein